MTNHTPPRSPRTSNAKQRRKEKRLLTRIPIRFTVTPGNNNVGNLGGDSCSFLTPKRPEDHKP